MSNSKSPLAITLSNSILPPRQVRRIVSAGVFALAVGLGLSGASAANISKAGNNNNLNLGTAWVLGTPPGASDYAIWDANSAGITTNSLGTNTTWQGISIQSPGAPVQINPDGSALTNGKVGVVGNVGIDMSAATQNLTLSNNFVVNGVQNWNIDSQTLTFGGSLARNAGGVIRFYGVGGATPTVVMTNGSAIINTTNSPNAMLGSTYGNIYFATLNDVDFVGLQSVPGGFQIEPGANTGVYVPNPNLINGLPTDGGNVNMMDFNNNTVYGLRLGNSRTYGGIRFNTPQNPALSLNGIPTWQITGSGTRTFTCNSILITTNVGACNVGIATGGQIEISSSGAQDMDVFQNNPQGDLTFGYTGGSSSGGGALRAVGTSGSLIKMGVGRLILNGGASSYGGGTRIYEGTLQLNSSSTAGTGAVNVFGGTFATSNGSSNNAPTTIFPAAIDRIIINSNGGFTLYNSNLTLQAGSHFQVAYSNGVAPSLTTAALVITNAASVTNLAAGFLAASNTVTVDILSGALAAGQYPLIKYSGTLGGDGGNAFVIGTIEPHASAYISNNVTSSSIDLVVTSVNQPLTWAVGNGVWDIATTSNWVDSLLNPTSYQQNFAAGDNVVFDDSTTGAPPITVTLNTSVTPSSVLFNNNLKTYTLSGSGSINGLASVTKKNPGTVFLQTTNFFTGGMNIDGGVVNFLTLTNLGAGPLNFGGGTLQYSTNTDDISVYTVNLNAGGGTIDVNGNPVIFAHPIGTSSSAGGLTVTGGTLEINGTNRYTGNTVINAGSTLGLQSANTFISNSAALVVNGALDAETAGANSINLLLGSGAGQQLVGTGTVTGEVATAAGTSISPGTNGTYGTLTISGDLTVNSATLVMDIAGPTGASKDLLSVISGPTGGGGLTLDNALNAGTLQLNVSGTLNNGVYPLISYAGALTGGAGTLILNGFNQPGSLAYLSASSLNNGTINLNVIPGATNSLTWNGLVNNIWDNTNVANWTSNGVTGQVFQNGDTVTFDDTGANPTIALGDTGAPATGAILPGKVLINATNNSYTFEDGVGDGSGIWLGPMSLVINSGVTNVTTLLTANGNSGPTTVIGGTLQIGNGSTTGDIGTGNITNKGTVVFDQTDSRTVAGQISGSGPLIQEGTSDLILLANNIYTNTTTINSGELQVGAGAAVGTLGTGPVTNNGTLFVNRSGSFALNNGVTGSGSVILAGGAAFSLSGALAWQGNTYLTNGSIKLAAANQIPNINTVGGSVGVFGLGGTLDLGGFNQMINGLTDLGLTNGIITNSAASTNILTIGLNAPSNSLTYVGLIVDNTNKSSIGLVIVNPGNTTLAGASTYRGNTTVGGGGTLTLGTAGSGGRPGNTSAGNGSITLSNGTTIFVNGNVTTFVGNPVILAPASTVLMEFQNLGNGYSGPISGDSASTLAIPNIGQGISFNGANIQQLNGFSGTVLLTNGCTLRYSATSGLNNGGTNTTFDVEGNGQVECRNVGTVTMGALVGTGFINGATTGGIDTYIIGGKNANDTFNGTIDGDNNLVKNGTATLTLAGSISNGFATAGLTYVGSTTVSNGTLQLLAPSSLNGTNFTSFNLASQSAVIDLSSAGFTPDNTNLVTNSTLDLQSAQSLNGIGTIYGGLIASNGSTVSVAFQPNTNQSTLSGTLTITTNAEFAGAIQLNLCRSNTPNAGEIASPTITIDPSATLVVTNVGPGLVNGDKFQLFSQSVSGFTSIVLPATDPTGGSNYVWTTNLTVDGSITLASGGQAPVALNPTNMTFSVSGSTLTITWPGDHLGWGLQSNSVSLTATNEWFVIPGSTTVTDEVLNFDQSKTNVFFRMQISH